MPQNLPLLDQIRIATPCPASWDAMRGDARARHCDLCQLKVYNFSAMTRGEAEALLQANTGQRLCGRLYRRADGTILTQDCPTGLRAWRRRVSQRAGVALSLLLGLFGGAFGQGKIPAHNKDTALQEAELRKSRANFERLPAKQDKAALQGVLYDANEAVIAGAHISLTNERAKNAYNLVSAEDGKFNFASIEPGRYTLEISSPGFQTIKVEELDLKANELVNAKIALEALYPTLGIVVVGEMLADETALPAIQPDITEKPKIKLPKKPND
jgi:hypothetical protein